LENKAALRDYMRHFLRKETGSNRPNSSRTAPSSKNNSVFDNKLYDCTKETLDEEQMRLIQQEECIQARIIFCMDDFGPFASIRLNHKPASDTCVTLFVHRKQLMRDQIRVAFGIDRGTTREINNLLCFELKLV